jgi:DNA-binding NarL/FixJ family response regulator
MPKILQIRAMTDEERKTIEPLSRSRSAPVRQVERARIVQWASEGQRVTQIAARLGVAENTVRNWLHRFNEAGLSGLLDEVPTGCATSCYS